MLFIYFFFFSILKDIMNSSWSYQVSVAILDWILGEAYWEDNSELIFLLVFLS